MATYQTVVPGTTITAAWGNNVRDGVVSTFATAAARASAITAPTAGQPTFRTDDKVWEGWDGAAYVPIGWRPIRETVLGATTASVSWASIPQNYKHLMIMVQARGDTAGSYTDVFVRCNNDSGANYVRVSYSADDTSTSVAAGGALSQTALIGFRIPAAALAITHAGGGIGWLRNYTDLTWRGKEFQSSTHAAIVTSMSTRQWFGTWDPASPAAVTRLDLFPVAGSFTTGSYFALYGFGA